MTSFTILDKIKVLSLAFLAASLCQLGQPNVASAESFDQSESDEVPQTTNVQPMSFDLGSANLGNSAQFTAPDPTTGAYQAASQGDQQHTTLQRQQASNMSSQAQNPNLPITCFGDIAGGGLPMTQFTGFVAPAGGQAELIYGDEGTDGPPPYFGFNYDNTIQSGL